LIKYICDVCGAEFDTEYYTGGYIDHMNLAKNRHYYESNLDELIDEVVFDGGSLRHKSDVDKRLNCVMHWDNLSDSTKEHVKMKVDALYSDHSTIRDKAYNDAEDIAKSNPIYAKYLRDALDANI
jgi:hypothetical protein